MRKNEDAGAALAAAVCPAPLRERREIVVGHGSGGRLSAELLESVFLPVFGNPILDRRDDQAVLPPAAGRLAFTTDSYVVTPIFFPGGDIGCMAVNGTINDLAVSGARPLYIAASFILEEGLAITDLRRVVESMQSACDAAGVQIVAGDTKVVDRGKGDQLFITTTGIGLLERAVELSACNARPRDKVLLSGAIGDHGIAILSRRENLGFDGDIESDTAALHTLTAAMLDAAPQGIRLMRDPTRGGLASMLNEVAARSRVGIQIIEEKVPVRESVRAACALLGLDPLYVANEGKLVAIVAPDAAEDVLNTMTGHPLGREARIIGEVVAERHGMVTMKTAIGGTRIVDMLPGEQLPRIC